jgi:hypothetical protein
MGDLLLVFVPLVFSSIKLVIGPTEGHAFLQPLVVGNEHCLLAILHVDVRLVIVYQSVIHMHDIVIACEAL